MAIVIKKKCGVTAAPVVAEKPAAVFVPGYTAEESKAIAEEALNNWIISLAKRLARANYERALQGGSP